MHRFRIALAMVALAALIGVAAWFGWSGAKSDDKAAEAKPQTVKAERGDVRLSVSAPGRLESTRRQSLAFASAGTISLLDVQPGDEITEGQRLATIDDSALRVQLADARSRLAAATRDYEKRLKAAKQSSDSARAALASARSVGATDTGALVSAVERADQQLASARGQGVDSTLRRAVSDAKKALEGAMIEAPFTGVVLENRAGVGEGVQPGQPVIVIADLSVLEIRATATEQDLPLLEVGQRAEVFFDAAPDATPTATVARIVPQRAEGDRALFPVYIALANLPGDLAIGMTADASIVVDERSDVLVLPRELVTVGGDGTAAIEVWVDGAAKTRIVEVGLRGDSTVEIVSGLSEGDEVVAE